MGKRIAVPDEVVSRLRTILEAFPQCYPEDAWVGTRWRVGSATVAHVFGGEDQLVRVTFHAEPSEVMAFEYLGPPYFRTEWSAVVVGMIIDAATDWDELTEFLTDSYCVQAPAGLAAEVRAG